MDTETSETSTLNAEKKAPEELFKKRVAQFDYYYDVRTFSYKLRKSVKPKDQRVKDHKYAIVIRRLIDQRGQPRGFVLDIKSMKLCDVLLDINKGVEGLELSRKEPEASKSLMYYSYPGLLERLNLEQAREEKDESLICDIQAGIFYVEKHMEKEVADINQMVSQSEISFDSVWALFFPNSLVYAYDTLTRQDTVLIIRRSSYGTSRTDNKPCFKVVCNIIKDDGDDFGFAEKTFQLDEYHGTRPISSLPVYPLRYHEHSKEVYDRAVDLGKRYLDLPIHSFREFSAAGLRTQDGQAEKIHRNERVMISAYAYARFKSLAESDRDLAVPYVHKQLAKESLTEDQFAICTPILVGFAFERNAWGFFAHHRLREVAWNDAAFDALVLGEKQKKLIHSLVRQHVKNQTDFDDIIKGKGRGLVGLLAGSPGCGKTLTAEAVAEVTHRPLYVLGAGELGTTPAAVEGKLVSVFELTQMWDAVLLLDEAEVFLTQRNITDLKRNALVSIFLRRLEYYQGIMILTTNMPEQCDRAFESRIHFSVHYPDLDFESRKTIWSMFFKRATIHLADAELCRLASHNINGRQIKNAFSSALTISQADGSQSRKLIEEIDTVLGVLNDWQRAMGVSSAPAVDFEGDLL